MMISELIRILLHIIVKLNDRYLSNWLRNNQFIMKLFKKRNLLYSIKALLSP